MRISDGVQTCALPIFQRRRADAGELAGQYLARKLPHLLLRQRRDRPRRHLQRARDLHADRAMKPRAHPFCAVLLAAACSAAAFPVAAQQTFPVDDSASQVLGSTLRLEPEVMPARGAALHMVSGERSEEHTSELQSLMRISYA